MTRNPHHDDEHRFGPLAFFGPVASSDPHDEEEPGGGGTGGGASSGND